MNTRVALVIVVLLGLSSAVVQAYFALSVPGLSSDDAYLHVRQVGHIRATFLPIGVDPLTDAPRSYVTPGYEYLLVALTLVMGTVTALKVVPAFFGGVLVVLVFFLTRRITNDPLASLAAAVATCAMPVLGALINTGSPATLVLCLTVILLLLLLNLQHSFAAGVYGTLLVTLAAVHPAVALVVIGLLFYAALLVMEEMKVEQAWREVLVFSLFFVLWSLIVRFRTALIALGPAVIYQNIPPSISPFVGLDVMQALALIGIVPFLTGGYMVYRYLFRERRRDIYLVLGFALAVGLLLWQRIIEPTLGLLFLGLMLSVLFGVWCKVTADFLAKTRFASVSTVFVGAVLAALLISSLWPAVGAARESLAAAPPQEVIDDLVELRQRLPGKAVLLTMTEEGLTVEALAERKVVQDRDFLLQPDAAQRYEDIQKMYTERSIIDAVHLLQQYGVTHIYISPEAERRYGKDLLPYITESDCFVQQYEGAVRVVHTTCKVRES
jgi:hypothetical protein